MPNQRHAGRTHFCLLTLNGNKEAIPFGRVSAEELAESNYNLIPSRYIEVEHDERGSHLTPDEAFHEMEKAADQVLQRIGKIKETMQ